MLPFNSITSLMESKAKNAQHTKRSKKKKVTFSLLNAFDISIKKNYFDTILFMILWNYPWIISSYKSFKEILLMDEFSLLNK